MEWKDYITIGLPIILDGIFIFIAQSLLSKKIERLNKKQDIRDDVIIRFWNKLQDVNDLFIDVNIKAMRNPQTISNSLISIQQSILELIKYYDTNKFDLKVFSEEFEKLQNKWGEFEVVWKKYSNVTLTQDMQMKLGSKLQAVKEENQNLINEVRKKY